MQSILIIEDHIETRKWLVSIVQEAFSEPKIEEASTLEQGYACLQSATPSVILIDISLPDGSGLEFVNYAQQNLPDSYVVVTTIYDDDDHLFSAFRSGASGYLLKDEPRKTLVDGLSGIMSGKPPLSSAITRRLLRHFQQAGNASIVSPLSGREEEVLTLMAKGMGRNEIAELLGVSINTAASHIKSIYRKLNVSGRVEATIEAVKMGLVSGNSKRD